MHEQAKVISRDEAAAAAARARAEGRRVVFTNGCFDILHVGHARYLAAAHDCGDLLYVGVNSDESVRMLGKGPGRPLVPEAERAEMLAHLSSVDGVIVFNEPTPIALIEAIRPDVHVKGGDYRAEDLPEAEVVTRYGGRVEIMGLVEGRSTTNIVRAILAVHGSVPVP